MTPLASDVASPRPGTAVSTDAPASTATSRAEPRRSKRGRRMGAGAVIVVVAIAAGAGVVVRSGSNIGTADANTSTSTVPTTTATVARRDLIERATVDGTLGYGDATALTGPTGVVTALPAVGAVIERGQTVVEVEGKPVPLLYGTVPLWRPLSGALTDGADIQMLEANLQALGYADDLALTVDHHWDDATLTAVLRWQKALGHDQTGVVQPTEAIVHDGPVRVSKVDGKLGQPAAGGAGGGGVVEGTATTRQVVAKVKASQQTLVHAGDQVDVELPSGTTVSGHIKTVGAVATTDSSNGSNPNGGSGDATVDVTVTVDDASQLGALDQAPVSVKITSSAAKNVLAVPVSALLALREGGYAVEVQRGSATALVGVQTGAFANGYVQITPTNGTVGEGDLVVVPR